MKYVHPSTGDAFNVTSISVTTEEQQTDLCNVTHEVFPPKCSKRVQSVHRSKLKILKTLKTQDVIYTPQHTPSNKSYCRKTHLGWFSVRRQELGLIHAAPQPQLIITNPNSQLIPLPHCHKVTYWMARLPRLSF